MQSDTGCERTLVVPVQMGKGSSDVKNPASSWELRGVVRLCWHSPHSFTVSLAVSWQHRSHGHGNVFEEKLRQIWKNVAALNRQICSFDVCAYRSEIDISRRLVYVVQNYGGISLASTRQDYTLTIFFSLREGLGRKEGGCILTQNRQVTRD